MMNLEKIERKNMHNPIFQDTQRWMTIQESLIPLTVPNSCLLLTALDNGWQISRADIFPSWDQHGFVYLITLHNLTRGCSQQLILPKNRLVDGIINEYLKEPCSCERIFQMD